MNDSKKTVFQTAGLKESVAAQLNPLEVQARWGPRIRGASWYGLPPLANWLLITTGKVFPNGVSLGVSTILQVGIHAQK